MDAENEKGREIGESLDHNRKLIAKRLEQYREENGLAEGEEIPYQEGLFAKDELDILETENIQWAC